MPRKRTGAKPSIGLMENEPVHSDAVLIAQNEGRTVRSVDRSQDEDGNPVITTHTRPGTIIMYKPSEKHGYSPRSVSASAIGLLLRQGWKEVCPDCNARHIDKDGVESTSPNLCAAREPVKVGICRVCGVRRYDNQGFLEAENLDLSDPNLIDDELYTKTTPEQRVIASLNLHYWLKHPRQAQMMDLPPLPEAMRELVEGAKI